MTFRRSSSTTINMVSLGFEALVIVLLLLVCCYECQGITPPHGSGKGKVVVHRTNASDPLLVDHHQDVINSSNWNETKIIAADPDRRRKTFLGKLAVRLNRSFCASLRNFGIGIWHIWGNYWTRYSIQTAVRYVTRSVVGGNMGHIIARPIQRLFRLAYSHGILLSWQSMISNSIEWVSARVVHKNHEVSFYAQTIVGAPVVEELFYRLCILGALKYTFQKLHRARTQSNDEQVYKMVTPWSIIVSCWFAAGHMDPLVNRWPGLTDSLKGRKYLAANVGLMTQAFAGSLLMLSPVYEKIGILAAIGCHAAWNAGVFVPGLQETLLGTHLFYRCFKSRKLPWKTSPLQACCELWLEYSVALHFIDKFDLYENAGKVCGSFHF